MRYKLLEMVLDKNGEEKDDAKTVALWHFDEPSGTRKFSDASGHAHHLVGEGEARTGIPLAVEAHEKLTTIWGRLKK